MGTVRAAPQVLVRNIGPNIQYMESTKIYQNLKSEYLQNMDSSGNFVYFLSLKMKIHPQRPQRDMRLTVKSTRGGFTARGHSSMSSTFFTSHNSERRDATDI